MGLIEMDERYEKPPIIGEVNGNPVEAYLPGTEVYTTRMWLKKLRYSMGP